jgi:hypothetical protein
MKWFWGILFVLLGVAYLGANFGLWIVRWDEIWQFWPVILILLGVAIISRRWRFGYILIIVITLLSFVFVFYVATYQPNLLPENKTEVKTANISEELGQNTKRAKIIIRSGAVKLNISDNTDKLVEGNFETSFGDPEIERSESGDLTTVSITSSDRLWHTGKFKNNLELNISNKIPVEIQIDAGASEINIDATNLMMNNLTVKSGASKIDLKVGEKFESKSNIQINSGASDIIIKTPKALGVSATIDSALFSKTLNGLKKISNNNYQSENWDTSSKQVLIDLNAGASSAEFDTY